MGLDSYGRRCDSEGNQIRLTDAELKRFAEIYRYEAKRAGVTVSAGDEETAYYRTNIIYGWVQDITGISLYTQWVSPEEVIVIRQKLEASKDDFDLKADFICWLTACIDQNLWIRGSF